MVELLISKVYKKENITNLQLRKEINEIFTNMEEHYWRKLNLYDSNANNDIYLDFLELARMIIYLFHLCFINYFNNLSIY